MPECTDITAIWQLVYINITKYSEDLAHQRHEGSLNSQEFNTGAAIDHGFLGHSVQQLCFLLPLSQCAIPVLILSIEVFIDKLLFRD